MTEITQPDLALLAFAREAQERSYSPYSGFRVGAAVIAEDGEIFEGFNIENACYSATMCAERAAVAACLASGRTEITAIAIVGDSEAPTVPCGECRQFLAEFNPEMRIVMGGRTDAVMVMRLDELFPEPFVRGFLDQDDEK